MSEIAEKLRWTVTVARMLRATTRPIVEGRGAMLTGNEVRELRQCYLSGWDAREAAEMIINRDRQAIEHPRSA